MLPALYQQSGFIPCALCATLLCTMSYFIGNMLTYSIQQIPHNQFDHLKVEYLDLIKYYIGHFNHENNHSILVKICQSMYLLFVVALLMGNLIQTCQTFDLAIARAFGSSIGFVYYPFESIGVIKGNSIDSISPFPHCYVISIGTIIIYPLIIPFCLKDLQVLFLLFTLISICFQYNNNCCINRKPFGFNTLGHMEPCCCYVCGALCFQLAQNLIQTMSLWQLPLFITC